MLRSTILYAGGIGMSRRLLTRILRKKITNYGIEDFSSETQLKNRLRQGVNNIVLIFTDMYRPGSSGFELIKDYAKRKEIPFILYGGGEEIGKEAVEQGAFDYVLKGDGNVVKNLTETIHRALNQ